MNFPSTDWQWLIAIFIAVVGILVAIWAAFKSSSAKDQKSGNTLNIGGSAKHAKINQTISKKSEKS